MGGWNEWTGRRAGFKFDCYGSEKHKNKENVRSEKKEYLDLGVKQKKAGGGGWNKIRIGQFARWRAEAVKRSDAGGFGGWVMSRRVDEGRRIADG